MTQQPVDPHSSQPDLFRATTIRDLETTWSEIQTKTFLSWVNHHLASKGVTVTDLREAFRDGVNLILLLEALANRRVGRYNPNPRFPSHKLDNITVALSFIENTWNVKVLGVNPNELMEGNLKQTMGILFLLIHKCKPSNERPVSEAPVRIPSRPRTDTTSFITSATKVSSSASTHPPATSAVTTSSGVNTNITTLTPDHKLSLPQESAHSLRDERKLVKRNAYASLAPGTILRDQSPIPESLESIKSKLDSEEAQSDIVRVQSYVRRYGAMQTLQVLRERLQKLKTTLCNSATIFRGLIYLQALIRGYLTRKHLRSRYKRNDIAREIISTEEVYVRRLGVLKNVFREELQKLGPEVCPPNVLRIIFSESEVIRLYNEVILQQLKERMKVWYSSGQKLGDIFLKMTEYLKVYTAYVNNYNDAFNTLMTLMKNPRVEECLNNCRARPECEGLDITSFLILPVQRIPRYVLLLQDLFKHTPEGHPDYKDLKDALDKMQKVADYVNEKKRIAENLNAVLAICNCITGLTTSYNLAQPHRKYVRQGRLIEVEGHQGEARTRGEERYCFLFNDLLLVTKEKSGYFKKHKDVKALTMSDLKDPKSELTFKCLYGLHIAEAQLVDLPDSENNKFNNMFQITKTNLSVLSSSFGLVKTAASDQHTTTSTTTSPSTTSHSDSKEAAVSGSSTIGSQLSSITSEDVATAGHLEEKNDLIFSALDDQDKIEWMNDIDECIANLLDIQRSRLGITTTTTTTQRETSSDTPTEEEKSLPDSLNQVTCEGELWKRGETDWKSRYFVLKGSTLLYFHNREQYVTSATASAASTERTLPTSSVASSSVGSESERPHDKTNASISPLPLLVTPTPTSTPSTSTSPAREVPTSSPSTSENTPRPVGEPSGVIPLLRATVKSVPISDRPFTLQILTRQRIYHLAAPSNIEKFNWINKMRQAIYQHLTYIKKERERERIEKEKQDYDPALVEIRRSPQNNNQCAECEAKDPLWVSLTFGVFLCDECAQIHKSLGAWNQLKTIHKDSKWTSNEIESLKTMGNTKAKEKYLKNVNSSTLSQPTEKDSAEKKKDWIMTKYESVIKEEREKQTAKTSSSSATETNTNTENTTTNEKRSRGTSTVSKGARESKTIRSKEHKRKRLHSKSKSEKMKPRTSQKDISKFNKDGTLLRRKDHHWHKYHVILKDGILSYYRPRKTKPSGTISLVLCQSVKGIAEKEMKTKEGRSVVYTFNLQTPERIFTWGCSTKDEAEEWKSAIDSSIRCLSELKSKK